MPQRPFDEKEIEQLKKELGGQPKRQREAPEEEIKQIEEAEESDD